jgi:hypothetical protein
VSGLVPTTVASRRVDQVDDDRSSVCRRHRSGITRTMAFILWLIAVILVVAGIVSLLRGAALAGILLIVVGLLVGPGGVSVFT